MGWKYSMRSFGAARRLPARERRRRTLRELDFMGMGGCLA